MPASVKTTPATRRTLRVLGQKLKRARRLRRLPMELVAERAGLTRPTLRRVEAGDQNVRMGSYLLVIQALGLLEGFADLHDPLSEELIDSHLSTRTRSE